MEVGASGSNVEQHFTPHFVFGSSGCTAGLDRLNDRETDP
jgi:hypothetical protein